MPPTEESYSALQKRKNEHLTFLVTNNKENFLIYKVKTESHGWFTKGPLSHIYDFYSNIMSHPSVTCKPTFHPSTLSHNPPYTSAIVILRALTGESSISTSWAAFKLCPVKIAQGQKTAES